MGAYGGQANCSWPEVPLQLSLTPADSLFLQREDTLSFISQIDNNTEEWIPGDYWLSILMPDSATMILPGDVLNHPNPLSGEIAPGDSLSFSNSLFVPSYAPIGLYRLIGKIGIFPDTVTYEESFYLRVVH